MISQYVFENFDFAFLVFGSVFFFLGAASLILAAKKKERFVSWLCLALFAFARGVTAWLDMAHFSLDMPRFLGPWRGIAAGLSFVFLFEFFRREARGRQKKGFLLGAALLLGAIFFLHVFRRGCVLSSCAPIRFGLIISTCLAASWVFLRKAADSASQRIAACSFFLIGLVLFSAGFVFVRAVGVHERRHLDKIITADARLLRSALGDVDFKAFDGARDGSLYPYYRAMHAKMAELSDITHFIRSLYLVTIRDGRPSFAVGSQAQIFPLDVVPPLKVSVPGKIMMDALHSKNPTFWHRPAPPGDREEAMLSVFIPLLNSKGEARSLLGMELDARKIQRQISGVRVFALFIIGSFFLLLIAGYVSLTVFAFKNAELEDQKARLKKVLLTLKEAEAELAKSEETFRGILNNSPNAIFGFDRDFRLVFWNTGAERTYGYRRSELIDDKNPLLSKKITDVLGQDASARLEEVFDGVTRQEEGAQKTRSGSIDAAMTLFPVKDKQGRILFAMGLVQDMSRCRHT